jgi:pyruvate dehydrogenase E2 component (dihydrolipoamide acetyltransferase)/2-oxoisovalerate dehydrogenase E2 component (dihydrolipoyl transacylase)
MARKLGIDLGLVEGTGPEGRILIGDLSPSVRQVGGVHTQKKSELRLDHSKPGTRVKLLGLRRKIAEHMVRSKRTIPHYSYVDECDVTALVGLRDQLREPFARAGLKLTYLPFFVKAAVAALREVPIVNSSLDEEAGEIVLHDRYHIGVAVATPGGLIVPVIHDADKLDLAALAREIDRLSAEARAGKARLEDLRGGTFTVTSIGGVGGLISTPVINHPEVAIMGLGKVTRRPMYDPAGRIRPADLIYLSFSFDHRVLDGAVGALFGNAVIQHLQNPAAMMLPDKFA